ncbi:MAG: hypothetical protein II453_09650 [Alphaproteobacteria bacterium]|nr:hypothetical protein [Alphaproteobacteria bacterium]
MGGKLKYDYTGTVHGCWKVIERDLHPISKSHETFWIAECQNCGRKASVRKTDLDKNPRTCNNCKGLLISTILEEKGVTIHPVAVGDRFGLLTAIDRPRRNGTKLYVKCKCDCGNIINVRKDHLLGLAHSKTISCGCATKSSGELKIEKILSASKLNYITQYIIPDFSLSAPFDFAILNDNNELIELIEFDGEQHYQAVEFFGGEEQYALQQARDNRKNEYCKNNNIKLKRIPYWDYDKITIEYLLS